MSSLKDSKIKQQTNGSISSSVSGEVYLDKSTGLTRLNYFDGKFLRAADLQLEQAAMLNQIRLANQASGGGLIHGFDCVLAGGNSIRVSAGLAYDWQGRALVLSQDIEVSLMTLLDDNQASDGLGGDSFVAKKASFKGEFSDCEIRQASIDPGNLVLGEEYYLVLISHVEAYCGEEDVYGKMCSEACISDTQRTHIVEGIQISLVPLILSEPLKQSTSVTLTQKHLRSRLVSAFYEQERDAIASLISQQGLTANTWCLGAEALTGQGIPIAVVSRKGSSVLFLDAWGVRRERIDTPPEIYWAARMGMRAKQVFWAQVLQFQCQLQDCLGNYDPEAPPLVTDPCAEEKALIKSAAGDMKQLLNFYADVSTRLTDVSSVPIAKIATLDVSALKASIGRLEAVGGARLSQQLLIDCGIVELPSAGYLPVAPESSLTINKQVRQLMGAGVDLRFCSVRPDYVHHAIEEAQHLERICLLRGLDNSNALEQVDILVPDGVIEQQQIEIQSPGYQAYLDSSDTMMGMMLYILAKSVSKGIQARSMSNNMLKSSVSHGTRFEFQTTRNVSAQSDFGGTMSGAARSDSDQQGLGFYLATENSFAFNFGNTSVQGSINFWGQMRSSEDVFSLPLGQRANLSSRFIMTAGLDGPVPEEGRVENVLVELNLSGQLIVEQNTKTGSTTVINGRFIGDVGFRYRTVDDDDVENNVDTTPINDTLIVSKVVTPYGEDIAIRVPSPALFGDSDIFELVYEQKHAPSGELTVRAYLITRGDNGPNERIILSGHFVRDDDVLSAGNSFYTRSMLAINNIASSLDNPGFTEMATSLLFPPPKTLPDDLTVTGSYPWVVFHRRRDKQCGQTQAPVMITPARDYRVFQVTVSEKMSRERLLALLESNFDGEVAEALEIGTTQFAANSQVMSSPHDNLRNNWQQKIPDDVEVLVSAIASQGEVLTEGTALASARLQTSNSVLDPVADFDGAVPLVVKEMVPTNLNIAEADGAIVYFTRKVAVKADCHALYQVLSRNPDDAERRIQDAIVKYNAGSTNTTFDAVFNDDMSRKLPVAPHFVNNTANYLSANEEALLKEAWLAAGGEYVTHSAVLYSQETPDVAVVAAQQRDKILETTSMLESEPGENRAELAVPSGMLDACQRATVLLVASQCHQVYLVAFAGRDELLIPGAQTTDAETAQLDSIFTEFDNGYQTGMARYYQLGEMVFYWDNPQPVTSSAQGFAQAWKQNREMHPQLNDAINRARLLSAYSTVQIRVDNNGNADVDPSPEMARSQAMNLNALMELPTTTTYQARETDNQSFPTSCPVVTFIVVDTVNTNLAAGEFTRTVRFNQNNELMRGPQFENAMASFVESGARVAEIELAYDNDADQPAAEARAKALKAVLLEQGLAARNTKVTAIKRDRNDAVVRKQVNLVLRNQ